MMTKHRIWLRPSGIAGAFLLVPALAFGAEKQPDGTTGSRVADTGQEPYSIEITGASTKEGGITLGTIQVTQLAEGLLFEPGLKGLEPGLHGFHVHENASCNPGRGKEAGAGADNLTVKPAAKAGDHWDPGFKGNHAGPWGRGHLGDLPNLYVNEDGVARHPVYAPRLTLRDLERRALVIHAERDNYTDEPDSSGGSGTPVGCGAFLGRPSS